MEEPLDNEDHEIDQESESWQIPTSDSDSGSLDLHDPRTVQGQNRDFWIVECKSRVQNGDLTPYERRCLQELPNHTHVLASDVQKVIRNFGAPLGATAPCRRTTKCLATQSGVAVGQMVHFKSPLVSLCKHLLLAERNYTQELVEGPTVHGCSCFAKTYLQPEGCPHKRLNLYQKDRFLPTTLCSHCSTCVRCKKLLGQTSINLHVCPIDCRSYCWKYNWLFALNCWWLRLCKVAARREFTKEQYKTMLDNSQLCYCHPQAGIYGKWRHYHLESLLI